MPTCPKCQSAERQNKDGLTAAGSQRYRCVHCGCRYTPVPKENGYDEDIRLSALSLYLEGLSLREIGRVLEVNHQSIANWIAAYATYLPPDMPQELLEQAQLDGLFDPTKPRGRRVSSDV